MMQHVVTAWVRARLVGVLGFGVLFFVLLSAFTLAGAFFGFDFAGDRVPYPELLDPEEPRPFVCLGEEIPCLDNPSEICCKPDPNVYFQFGTADTTASRPE